MTEMLTWLGAWYNLLPVFCVLLSTGFALIQIFFGFLPDSMDADIDADGDIDLDLDLDIDADVDLDVDVDVDVDADVDASGGAFEGLGGTVLAFAGFGKAQTSLLLMMRVFLFGACSLLLSWLLGPLRPCLCSTLKVPLWFWRWSWRPVRISSKTHWPCSFLSSALRTPRS